MAKSNKGTEKVWVHKMTHVIQSHKQRANQVNKEMKSQESSLCMKITGSKTISINNVLQLVAEVHVKGLSWH